MSKNFSSSMNKVSRLFPPIKVGNVNENVNPKKLAKSYKLMNDMGIIRQANTGLYTLLPLGMRVLQKLINIVDMEMSKIGAQKLILPNLTSAALWKKTKRLENHNELFTVLDRHKNKFILSPTFEEAITDMVASMGAISRKDLPLMLYQISNKWRDELKPRLGLLRGREFIMKDLYSFDSTVECAENTYTAVRQAYEKIFKHIGIEYTIAVGDTGIMGGSLSHEYHYISNIGEDTVLSCHSCGFYINSNIYEAHHCPTCNGDLTNRSAVEVGHTFLLGTKYSEPLNAIYLEKHEKKPMNMGCYGLGLTRIIATAVETLSKEEEIRWPKNIAPYTVCIIPPKKNSHYDSASPYTERIYNLMEAMKIDTIIDDRVELTIGRRVIDARRMGYPYLIVIGKTAVESTPRFEVHDISTLNMDILSLEQVEDFFANRDSLLKTEKQAITI